MLKIDAIKQGSSAEKSGLQQGDILVSIGRNRVADLIDFMYHADADAIRAGILRNAVVFDVEIRRDDQGLFGLRFEPLRPLTCSNKCVFCFVDQLPGGLRESLYIKDEDYRLSFLYGNFVTMTNLGSAALDRIVRQKLSPLYVSVHATDPSVRARMLGVSGGVDLLPKLKVLKEGGIEIHAQIVLCPGMNDGAELQRTVLQLAGFFPCVRSVAIVPVGTTRFREGLPLLKPVDAHASSGLLESLHRWQRIFFRKMGTRFVFAADEFYLLVDSEVPKEDEYEGFPQLENGVGVERVFLKKTHSLKRRIRRLAGSRPVAVLTGRLAEPVCAAALSGDRIRVVGVTNRFFGESVTVSGLLTGQDILSATADLKPEETAVISGNCLNEDGLFLDGMRLRELEELCGHTVLVEEINDGKFSCCDIGTPKRGQVHAFQ